MSPTKLTRMFGIALLSTAVVTLAACAPRDTANDEMPPATDENVADTRTPAETTTPRTGQQPATESPIDGRLDEVVVDENQIVVMKDDGEEITLQVDSMTVIQDDTGSATSLEALADETGQRVRVEYSMRNDIYVARSIDLLG